MPNAHVDVNTHPTKKEVRPSASISSHLTLTLTLMRCWQCDP
jgi:DNA mismatch repair ATPase MutL